MHVEDGRGTLDFGPYDILEMETAVSRLVAAILVLSVVAPASAQLRRGFVKPGPGIPPHLSSPSPNGWLGPVRPVQPIHRPGLGTALPYPGWQPWLNRGWVNTVGVVPGNVYVDPYAGQTPLVWRPPTPPPAPVVVTPQRESTPVRPKVLELNPETGRLEEVPTSQRRSD